MWVTRAHRWTAAVIINVQNNHQDSYKWPRSKSKKKSISVAYSRPCADVSLCPPHCDCVPFLEHYSPPFSILNADFKLSAVSLHCTRSLYSSFGFFYHFVLFAVKYGIHTRTQITLWIFCKVTRLWRSPCLQNWNSGSQQSLYKKKHATQ